MIMITIAAAATTTTTTIMIMMGAMLSPLGAFAAISAALGLVA